MDAKLFAVGTARRRKEKWNERLPTTAPEPSGKAWDCKSLTPGSNPGGASKKIDTQGFFNPCVSFFYAENRVRGKGFL